jgi:hypothetical protein
MHYASHAGEAYGIFREYMFAEALFILPLTERFIPPYG